MQLELGGHVSITNNTATPRIAKMKSIYNAVILHLQLSLEPLSHAVFATQPFFRCEPQPLSTFFRQLHLHDQRVPNEQLSKVLVYRVL